MAAYRADIEIGVRGARSLEQLRSSINLTARAVDSLNEVVGARGSLVQSLQNYTNNLNRAARSLQLVGAGTQAETKAVREYVQALGEANAARARQNSLVAQELANQRRITPGNAGYGQQGPALPPAVIRSQQVQQNWNRFFQEAANVAQDLQTSAAARTLNLKTNWGRFFQNAAEVAQDLQTSTTTKAAGIRTSWNTFFQEARNLALDLTAQVRRTEAAASAAARQRLAEESARRASIRDAGFGIQGPALPPGVTSAARGGGGSGRAGNAISSAIIGGGFPLLFGQGPAAAAGGALGGVAGGLLGGGFGFALAIAGTAIGDFIAQADALNVTLAGLNATITSTGAASITTASDVSELAKNLQITKDEAIELVSAFSQFTDGNIRESLARGFGAVGGAQTFEAIAKAGLGEKEALEAIFSLRKQIGNEAAEQLALQLKSVGATETQAALLKIVSERNIDILVAQSKTVQFADRLLSTWESIVAAVASSVSLAVRFIAKMQEGSLIKLPFLDRIQQVLGKVVGRTPEQIAGERGAKLEQQLRKELSDLRNALRQETGAQGLQASLANSMKTKRDGKSAAEREAERLAKQRQKQLEAAARLAVSTDTQVKKAAALTEQEKLTADLDQQRMERMVKYETLYKEALSNAEIEYLVIAQTNEIVAEKLNYERELLDIALQQSDVLNKTDPLSSLQKEIDLIAAKLQGKEEEYLRQQAIDELVAKGVPLKDAIAQIDARTKLNALLQQQAQLEQLIGTVGQGMGDALTNVFDALIARTENFNNVLRNTLASLGRFLMMAGLNALADAGDPSGQGTGILSFLGFGKGFGKRAGGGPVTTNAPYLVGERGPELFVPGTGGSVVPTNDLRAAMGSAPGSSGGPVLNMSFETTSIAGVEYVSREQLEQAMAATRRQAANDGAKRGMNMTLDRIQQSPQTRSRIGIR